MTRRPFLRAILATLALPFVGRAKDPGPDLPMSSSGRGFEFHNGPPVRVRAGGETYVTSARTAFDPTGKTYVSWECTITDSTGKVRFRRSPWEPLT